MTVQDLRPTTLLRKLNDAYQRQQTRRALQDLTPDQLRDIGITAEQAFRESRQPFWKNHLVNGNAAKQNDRLSKQPGKLTSRDLPH